MLDNLFQQYASTDYFFYFQQNELHSQCEADLSAILMQPKRKMYFNRQFGSGAGAFRNYPVGFMLQLGVGFSIADSVAYRNTTVTDGSNGSIDRRIAASQSSITVDNDDKGDVDITVLYYLFADQKKPQSLKMNTGLLI